MPVQGYRPPSEGFGPFFSRAILPSLTLATIYIALIARMTRASMLEVLGEDYIRTARAKGVRENVVLFRHALRNAAVPILTVIGTGFALLISGVVVTEIVFNIPGIGRLTVDAILARDYPGHPGDDPADRGDLRRREPSDRRLLFLLRSKDQVLT